MPTYHYRCPDGHDFDLFQRMSDDPGADCPECGKPAERQLSGGAGFLFKGEGFYITDYRSKEYKERARAEEETASGDTSGGSKESGKAPDSAPGSGSESGTSRSAEGSSAGKGSGSGDSTAGGSAGGDA